jgi:hypothetical protein
MFDAAFRDGNEMCVQAPAAPLPAIQLSIAGLNIMDEVNFDSSVVRRQSHRLHDDFSASWAAQLLCTFISAIIDAYTEVLDLIKDWCLNADSQLIHFNILDLGSVWGQLEARSSISTGCFDGHEMKPTMWRVMIRALLRTDLHGFDIHELEGDSLGPCHHPGLVDHLSTLETRWRLMVKGDRAEGEALDGLERRGVVNRDELRMIKKARSALASLGLT